MIDVMVVVYAMVVIDVTALRQSYNHAKPFHRIELYIIF